MKHLVIGQGEIGRPLFDILKAFGSVDDEYWIRDMYPGDEPVTVDVVHICYPFSDTFVPDTIAYLNVYGPSLTIIHSTVLPGTTAKVAADAKGSVAYSPVRGRHGNMHRDLVRYTKFVSAIYEPVAWSAYEVLGQFFDTEVMLPVEGLELAKLLATSYTGLLIAWAQEMDRYSQKVGADYLDVALFFDEPGHFPPVAFQPGHIGGHCIMQNLDLLAEVMPSDFIKAIEESNDNIARNTMDRSRIRPRPFLSLRERDA